MPDVPTTLAAQLRARENNVESGYQRIVEAVRDLVALIGQRCPAEAIRVVQTSPQMKEAEDALRELGR